MDSLAWTGSTEYELNFFLFQDEKIMTSSVTQHKLAPLVTTESNDDDDDEDVSKPIDKDDVDWNPSFWCCAVLKKIFVKWSELFLCFCECFKSLKYHHLRFHCQTSPQQIIIIDFIRRFFVVSKKFISWPCVVPSLSLLERSNLFCPIVFSVTYWPKPLKQ